MLSVDEKSQIQALDRSQPVLPIMASMPERRTHDYVRNGLTTLLAGFVLGVTDYVGRAVIRRRPAS